MSFIHPRRTSIDVKGTVGEAVDVEQQVGRQGMPERHPRKHQDDDRGDDEGVEKEVEEEEIH